MKKLMATVLALSCWSAAALAQDSWPNRPLTMVVPFAAGGPVDVLGRLVGQYLGEALGKPVVIENIAGAGGMTGSQRVMQAAPDGYTFVLGSIGTHALNQTLYKRPLYNAAIDFAPVALIADVPLVLIARKDLPVRDLPQFINYVKANQGKMQFGSGGTGTSSHIGCVLLNQVIGVNLTHVPYRGGGPALVDLLGGRIDYLCNILSTAVEPIKAGQVKALAMLAPERAPVLAELKTAHEQGLDNAEAYTWNAIFLPKATPPEIVGRLNAAIVKVMDNPAFQQKLDPLGLAVVAPARRSPEYLGRFVASEIDKWAGPIKASGAVGE